MFDSFCPFLNGFDIFGRISHTYERAECYPPAGFFFLANFISYCYLILNLNYMQPAYLQVIMIVKFLDFLDFMLALPGKNYVFYALILVLIFGT